MKILHVVSALEVGGVETWLLQVLEQIDGNALSLDVLVSRSGHYDKRAREFGAAVIPCPPASTAGFERALGRVLREHGPYDVVHSHIWLASGRVMRVAEKAGVPVRIVHSRNTATGADLRSGNLLRRFYRAWMRRWIDRYATHLLAISGAAGEGLYGRSWRWAREGRIIPTAVDLEPFEEAPDGKALRRSLDITGDAKVVGHIGRFSEQKNHRFLLELFATARRRNPELHLLLVGDGPLRASTEGRVEDAGLSGAVTFAGIRSDVPDLLMGVVDVLAMPSQWEGIGRVVVEAQAAGVRCVLSRHIPDEAILLHDQVTQLALNQPTTTWAAAVADAAAAPRPDRRASLEAVRASEFNLRNAVQKLEQLYREALSSVKENAEEVE